MNLSGTLPDPPMAVYATEEPSPRTRANTVIHTRLLAEPQYQAVLKIVERYLPRFDFFNMITAMHKCAITARDQAHLKRQIQFDPAFVQLYQSTKKAVQGNVANIRPRDLADLLWSCARLDIYDSELFNEIIEDSSKRLDHYNHMGITLLVFALGYVGQRPRAAFMQALVRELRVRIDKEFNVQDISTIAFGLQRLGIRDDRLMKIITERLLRVGLERSHPLPLACTAYAFSKLEYWNENLFVDLGHALLDRVPEMGEAEFMITALAFSNAAGSLRESHFVMDELLRGVGARVEDMSNSTLAVLSLCAGKFNNLRETSLEESESMGVTGSAPLHEEHPFAAEVLEQVGRRKMSSLTMSETNLITYALMRMRNKNVVYLADAAKHFATNAAELTQVEICNAMYAFAQQGYLHMQFVHALMTEVKRRNLMDSMGMIQVAQLVYALGVLHVMDEDIMEKAVMRICESAHEVPLQAMSMIMWAAATLNMREHAELLTSACMEELATRCQMKNSDFNQRSCAITMWAASILCGSSAAMWALDAMFSKGFWDLESYREMTYAMMYHFLVSLKVDKDIKVESLDGWVFCKATYEESSSVIGQQNRRLAERLAMQSIPHRAGAMVPKLPGRTEAGVRADIIIESLNLVIEVEGPQRSTIPLKRVMAELGDEDIHGPSEEVLGEVKKYTECGFSGSASWKRRVLVKCGWRVVTVSFDENEEYIADALRNMVNKDRDQESEATESEEPEAEEEEEELAQAQVTLDSGITFSEENIGDEDMRGVREVVLTEYELKLRDAHKKAMKKLKRRILEERGNAAAAALYSNHLEYRRWQVGLEHEVFEEMLASM